jgi:hypothetical protein
MNRFGQEGTSDGGASISTNAGGRSTGANRDCAAMVMATVIRSRASERGGRAREWHGRSKRFGRIEPVGLT